MVESIKELRKICQAPVIANNSWFAVNFVRRISIYFTKLFLYTPISGNQMTFIFTLTGLAAGSFFISGKIWHALIGALILQLWYVFDHVDGEIARYRQKTSLTGVYFDYMSHYIVHPYVFACITFGIYNRIGDVRVFIFGFLAAISVMLIEIAYGCRYQPMGEKRLKMLGKEEKSASSTPKKRLNVEQDFSLFKKIYRGIKQGIFRYPGVMNIITIAVIVDVTFQKVMGISLPVDIFYAFLFLYGIFAPLIWLQIIYIAVKKKLVDSEYNILFGE